eukprot:TRINITY_DN2624_c0_g1_i4.p1 TRINITY_DN2624_c0_g1~~TRINITY_DN2624_c0_g1_i4.p1  ORF type:complete len:265 (+),score=17.65 TRINITY_DN2624_c0_g1_i4:118-912(+)
MMMMAADRRTTVLLVAGLLLALFVVYLQARTPPQPSTQHDHVKDPKAQKDPRVDHEHTGTRAQAEVMEIERRLFESPTVSPPHPTSPGPGLGMLCDGNKFGPLCEHDFFKTVYYLPSEPTSSTNGPFNDQRSRMFQSALHKIQMESACEDVLLLSGDEFSWGFGSAVHGYLVSAMITARAEGLTFSVNPSLAKFNYARGDPAHCATRSYECFFEPFSSCDHKNVTEFRRTRYVTHKSVPDLMAMPEEYLHHGGYYWYGTVCRGS